MNKAVSIQLDKVRNLRYGINALCTIEDLLGKSISSLDLQNLSMKDLRLVIFAGLLHEDNTLTPEKVGALIDDYSNIGEISQKLGEAFTLAFGEQKNRKNPQRVAKIGG